MGIVAPVTARETTCNANVGVTSAVPMLKTSMPEDVTWKVLPKFTVKEVPAAISVFIRNESTRLLQGPVLQEVTAAEVTIKPDRGPVGEPAALALSIVVLTVTVLAPAVCAPVVSPVTVTV